MISPTGHPEPELSLKKTSNNQYTCSYKVVEQGEHVLHVYWGGEDVPGSPFVIAT
jgi:hypothetical protein